MPRKTYLDSCVLISAFRGTEATSSAAMAIIQDLNRTFVVSHILELECIATARRSGNRDQEEFCQEFISRGQHVELGDSITAWAVDTYSKFSIQPMDLLHIAVAVGAQADDFVTAEQPSKPFFSINAPLQVISIA